MTGRTGRTLRRFALRIPGAGPAYHFAKAVWDADYRSVRRLVRGRADGLFQPFPDTFEDRYPLLFDEVARRLGGLQAPRILSFGCSTGEEVRALRRRLPHARITGIDINPRMVAKARQGDASALSRYAVGNAPPAGACFDAIFAMAVFRHGHLERDLPASSSAILPFSRFEEAIALIDKALAPGGLLALGNANFRLRDAKAGARYRVEMRLADAPPVQDVLYGPDDMRLNGVVEDAVLFAKPEEGLT